MHTITSGLNVYFSFKVENYNDAVNALKQMKQPTSGWYVERTKYGQVTKNEFIKIS